jgi:hypothetical protein
MHWIHNWHSDWILSSVFVISKTLMILHWIIWCIESDSVSELCDDN